MDLDYKRVKEVGNGSYAFTLKTDEKNILATYGLGPCIAILAVEKKLGFAFLAHSNAAMSYDYGTNESLHINKLVYIMKDNKDKQFDLEFMIFNGMDEDPERLSMILDSIKGINLDNCTISSVSILGSFNGTVFYDPVTQVFGEYDRQKNVYKDLAEEVPEWATRNFTLEDLRNGTVDKLYGDYYNRRKF